METTEKAMQHPILAFRPGEQRVYAELPFDQDGCYAVMLLETPPLPMGFRHAESLCYTVLCAGQYSTVHHELKSWGWVYLDFDTKEIIGTDMMEYAFEPGRWYYMIVTGGLGVRDQEYYNNLLTQAEPDNTEPLA